MCEVLPTDDPKTYFEEELGFNVGPPFLGGNARHSFESFPKEYKAKISPRQFQSEHASGGKGNTSPKLITSVILL